MNSKEIFRKRLEQKMTSKRYITAIRPKDHPKGYKVLMKIPEGQRIPPGIILGKGTQLIIVNEDSVL